MKDFLRFIYKLLLFVVFISGNVALNGQGFATNSVLKSGSWYKIKIEKTGIYKIRYSDLTGIGFEAPENIRIYGNGGAQLPTRNSEPIPDDLQEVPLYHNASDKYYLFYAEGNTVWNYDESNELFKHDIHDYSTTNYYYITASFGSGKIIEEKDNSGMVETQSTSEYDVRDYHEYELVNLMANKDLGSGKRWFGESLTAEDFNAEFDLNDPVNSNSVKIKTAMAVRSGSSSTATVYANGASVASLRFSVVNLVSSESTYADIEEKTTQVASSGNTLEVSVVYNVPDNDSKAYLDYVLINSRSNLHVNSDAFFFRDAQTMQPSSCTRFNVDNVNSTTRIWNVTDHNNVYAISLSLSGTTLTFKDSTSSLNEYVAVDVTSEFSTPIFEDDKYSGLGWLEDNQNLHGETGAPELLIVTHPDFIEQANQLADLHRNLDGMDVLVATTEQVYNEFSSGKSDAVAIRNVARMFYERSTNENQFKYLLLFGDGSFDNRGQDEGNPNYIPTFQSDNSISPTSSYFTDDIYGMLEPDEWSTKGSLDIGVGRIPVKSTNGQVQAQGVVDKIITYYDRDIMSDWRNQMIFLGDDGESSSGWDNTIFMTDSDILTEIVEECAPAMNFTKIYLDAYTQVSSSTGASYPEVEEALDDAFTQGALVFNYMGHGGERAITQEKVLQSSDFQKMNNGPYYPLFMTATCQMGRYDNVSIKSGNYASKVSAGEEAFLNPKGGAIALYTTTRLVYQSSNLVLGKNVYKNMFGKDENGDRYRFGDIIRLAKNATPGDDSNINKFKFALIGDPAITLPHGKYNVITDSINGLAIQEVYDTVNALGKMSISGFVAYDDSTIIDNFNGVVYIKVFDKEYVVSTRGNDGQDTIYFDVQDKVLFQGKASVIDGRFNAEFIIPKDISYSYGVGKISYYAQNLETDAKGATEEFIIGGTSQNIENDIEGPKVTLYVNDTSFIEGGITSSNPILLAYVYDKNGINTTGIGIGHDIVGILDDDYTNNYSLNDYFEGDLDDYKRGVVSYPIYDLPEGSHEILVRVWDTYNNSSEETIGFYVKESDDIVLDKVYNYPNPMRTYTNFQYSHTVPGEHEVTLEIYDLSGKLIYNYSRTNEEQGFVSAPLYWERSCTEYGHIAPGIYPYRIKVNVIPSDGSPESTSFEDGRLIIIP